MGLATNAVAPRGKSVSPCALCLPAATSCVRPHSQPSITLGLRTEGLHRLRCTRPATIVHQRCANAAGQTRTEAAALLFSQNCPPLCRSTKLTGMPVIAIRFPGRTCTAFLYIHGDAPPRIDLSRFYSPRFRGFRGGLMMEQVYGCRIV